MKKYWSMTEGGFNCLIDEKRTTAFARAISNTVKPGNVVVDLGAGSGILAMLAADVGQVVVAQRDRVETGILINVGLRLRLAQPTDAHVETV